MSIRELISYVFPICCLSPRSRKNQSMKANNQNQEIVIAKTKDIGLQSLLHKAQLPTLPSIEECHLPLIAQGALRIDSDLSETFRQYLNKNKCISIDYRQNKPS